ncbi:MAG: hypothetical protein IJS30_06160 [Bacteroidales bacterium]|nr:hypothetical protein [Bacteroidales bacterium]
MVDNMRKSRVLEKMRAGQVATCFKLNMTGMEVAEIAALSGFDCLWLDREHCVNGWQDIKAQILAAKAYGADTMVRVSRGPYSNLIKPFEMDATGIMVPHVMSLAEAKQIVYYTKFHPVGRRPIDGGNADGAYCLLDGAKYMEQANEQRFTVLQIEDPEPLEELEEIAALPGFDMLFFGPADFSQGIGDPLNFNNPLLKETRKRVAELAHKYGKFAGTTGGVQGAPELIDMGYNFISMGADVVGVGAYCAQILEDYHKLTGR